MRLFLGVLWAALLLVSGTAVGQARAQLRTVVETPMLSRVFTYQSDFDTQGILFHLGSSGGTQPYQNPVLRGVVAVSASSVADDSLPAHAIVGRDTVRFTTRAVAGSWVQVDFADARVRATRYTLKHYSTWDTEALRNWVLEGSRDGVAWTSLRAHVEDRALAKLGATASWELDPALGAFRFFRVRQTGLNSNRHHFLALSGMELYGTLLTPVAPVPIAQSTPTSKTYDYQSDTDGRGIVRALGTADGTQPYRNPVLRGQMLVTASSSGDNVEAPADVLDNLPIRFATARGPGAWVQFDFRGRKIAPTRYGLRHYATWDTEALRNWVLEGSNDRVTWTTLSRHDNDSSLRSKGDYRTWPIPSASVAAHAH
jgi:hypothetical protein